MWVQATASHVLHHVTGAPRRSPAWPNRQDAGGHGVDVHPVVCVVAPAAADADEGTRRRMRRVLEPQIGDRLGVAVDHEFARHPGELPLVAGDDVQRRVEPFGIVVPQDGQVLAIGSNHDQKPEVVCKAQQLTFPAPAHLNDLAGFPAQADHPVQGHACIDDPAVCPDTRKLADHNHLLQQVGDPAEIDVARVGRVLRSRTIVSASAAPVVPRGQAAAIGYAWRPVLDE